MPVTERTFRKAALEDPEGHWELHRGRLREKPGTTASHNQIGVDLAFAIMRQFDHREFTVRINRARTKVSDKTYYIPDLVVVPTHLVAPQLGQMEQLAVFEGPLPFVAEIWSPPGDEYGAYDVDAKIPEYMKRGDREIWRIHPYERTVTAWCCQTDGSYAEGHKKTGAVRLHVLPDVVIDLDALFAGE